MMNKAKPIFMIFIMMLICCSYSVGQSTIGIGNMGISNGVPGTIGLIHDGAGVFPAKAPSNGWVYLGGIRPGLNVALHEFVCNSMSACGIYHLGKTDNSDGAIPNIGGVASGATVTVTHL